MNQILYTSNGKTSGPLPIQSIVKFFAVCIITFGIILCGEGAYNIFAVNIFNNNNIDNTIPEIEFGKDRKYCNYFYNS